MLPPLVICDGETVDFMASGGVQYEFYLNGISVQGPGPSANYSSASLTDGDKVYVLVDGVSGCTDTSEVLTINASSGKPGLIANDSTICQGDEVTFSAAGGNDYEFFVNGIFRCKVPVLTIHTFLSGINDGDEITVDVTNGGSCTGLSDGLVMTVNPVPVADLSTFSNSICVNDEAEFTATGGSEYEFLINGSSAQRARSKQCI